MPNHIPPYVVQEIGSRLYERLSYIKIQPSNILNLSDLPLQSLYPLANITNLDNTDMSKFANKQFDLIFANCSFLHIKDLNLLANQLHKILSIEGLLLFSTLGPDTLTDFVPAIWPDMHYWGDALAHAQFKNSVVDTETINFTYDSMQDLLLDLQDTGAYQIDLQQVTDLNKPCNANFEVIYGHAWGQKVTPKQFKDQQGRVFVSIEDIL